MNNDLLALITQLNQIPKVALIGIAGSGKDYIGALLQHTRVAFANPLREVCAQLYPIIKPYYEDHLKDTIIPEYSMSARQIWIKISATVRSIDDTVWIKRTQAKIQQHERGGHNIVVTDCRTLNELQTLKELGFYCVWIDNPTNSRPVNQYDLDNTVNLKDLCNQTYLNVVQ
jgi:hypothetical protein